MKFIHLLIPMAVIAVLASFSPKSHGDTAFTDYASYPASQTQAKVGPSGHGYQGDVIGNVIIVPSTTAAGSVTLYDGAPGYGSIPIYVTGTLSDLKPITVPVNMRSRFGAWLITTGANETVLINGRFQ